MNETGVVAIVVAVLGLFGGAGFWGYMSHRKDQPVKKKDADIAAAHQSQQMALAVADDLREDMTRIRADLAAETGRREQLAARVEGLEQQVREQHATIHKLRDSLSRAMGWIDDVIARWPTVRMQDQPPPRPHVSID